MEETTTRRFDLRKAWSRARPRLAAAGKRILVDMALVKLTDHLARQPEGLPDDIGRLRYALLRVPRLATVRVTAQVLETVRSELTEQEEADGETHLRHAVLSALTPWSLLSSARDARLGRLVAVTFKKRKA